MARDLRLEVVLQAIDRATAPIKAITGGSTELSRRLKETRESLKGLQAQQKDVSSFRVLQNASAVNSQAMQRNREKLRELSQAISKVGTPTKEMAEAFKQAARQGHELKAKHQQQQQALQKLRSRLKEAGINTRDLSGAERDLKQRIASTNTSLDSQTRRLKQLTAQQTKLAAAKDQYSKTQSLAGSMAGSGAAGLATGSGILYGAKSLIAPGMDFSKTMSKVQALARLEKDSEEMKALRAQARQLGADTQFSANDAASGQAFLAMAGFTPKAIMDAMPGLLDMALAGDMDLARTADISSNILGSFRLDSSQMGNVADILTKTFTTSNTSLEMLGETMKYVGPVAAAAGMGLEEAAAMAGLLGNVGIQSSQAGTTLRAMLLRLAAPAGPAAKAMKALGVSAKDSAGNVRNIVEVIGDVAKATEKMGSGDRLEALKSIFGEEPAAGMAEIINQSGAGGLVKYLDVVYDNEGASSKTAKTMTDNLIGDLGNWSSAFEEVQHSLFEQQEGGLRDLVKGFTEVTTKIGEWIKENPELTAQILKTVAGLGALIAIGGGLTLTIASILGPFAMVRYGMTLLGIKSLGLVPVFKTVGGALLALGKLAMANPIFLAIALIAAGAYLIYKNWDSIGSFFTDRWADIQQAFDGGLLGVLRLLVNWSPLGLFYKAFAAVLSYFDIELPASLFDAAEGLTSAILSGLGTSWSEVGAFFGNGWAEIKAACDGGLLGVSALILNWSPLGAFYQVFAAVMDYFGVDLPAKFTDFGGMLIDGFVNGITNAMGSARAAVASLGDSTIGWFKEKLGIHSPSRVFAELGGFTMQGLTQGLADGEGDALKQVSSTAKLLTERGAGAISFASDAAGQPLSFDNRPPLSMRPAAAAAAGNSTFNITINAAQGSDPNAIARAVAQELDRRERQRGVRQRSALYDTE